MKEHILDYLTKIEALVRVKDKAEFKRLKDLIIIELMEKEGIITKKQTIEDDEFWQ